MNSERLSTGVYVLYWKDGGSSVASVGVNHKGHRWFVPSNWLFSGNDGPCFDWWRVDRVEKIEPSYEPQKATIVEDADPDKKNRILETVRQYGDCVWSKEWYKNQPDYDARKEELTRRVESKYQDIRTLLDFSEWETFPFGEKPIDSLGIGRVRWITPKRMRELYDKREKVDGEWCFHEKKSNANGVRYNEPFPTRYGALKKRAFVSGPRYRVHTLNSLEFLGRHGKFDLYWEADTRLMVRWSNHVLDYSWRPNTYAIGEALEAADKIKWPRNKTGPNDIEYKINGIPVSKQEFDRW